MRDVCDLAHVLLVADLERNVLAERHVSAVLIAAGAEGVDMPSLAAALTEFDTELEAAPRDEPRPLRLLKRLGVA